MINKLISAIGVVVLASSGLFAAIDLEFIYDPFTNETIASWEGSFDVDSTATSVSASLFDTSSSTFRAVTGSVGNNTSAGINGTYPWSTTVSDWVFASGSDTFAIQPGRIDGPANFTSSTIMIGSMSRTGNLTDLGFANNDGGLSGTLTGTAGEVNWSTSVVPEPSEYTAIAAVAMLGFVAYRRRKVAKA